jgi:hypothetical protein
MFNANTATGDPSSEINQSPASLSSSASSGAARRCQEFLFNVPNNFLMRMRHGMHSYTNGFPSCLIANNYRTVEG